MSEYTTIPTREFLDLLAVARLYVDAFKEDELMSLTERIGLQDIEDILERHKEVV